MSTATNPRTLKAHLVDALEEAVLLLFQDEHHIARLHGGVAAPRLPTQHDLCAVLLSLMHRDAEVD